MCYFESILYIFILFKSTEIVGQKKIKTTVWHIINKFLKGMIVKEMRVRVNDDYQNDS